MTTLDGHHCSACAHAATCARESRRALQRQRCAMWLLFATVPLGWLLAPFYSKLALCLHLAWVSVLGLTNGWLIRQHGIASRRTLDAYFRAIDAHHPD